LVLSAPLGSNTLNLAKAALRHGKRVLTIEHRMNEELLGCNASPATCDNILTVLG
jgi:predicted Rossmann fold nucleotide-binding protein DprA/Smf involved in DNA uptake